MNSKKKRLPVENKRKGMNWHANNFVSTPVVAHNNFTR